MKIEEQIKTPTQQELNKIRLWQRKLRRLNKVETPSINGCLSEFYLKKIDRIIYAECQINAFIRMFFNVPYGKEYKFLFNQTDQSK